MGVDLSIRSECVNLVKKRKNIDEYDSSLLVNLNTYAGNGQSQILQIIEFI